jgi:hypothetical protein
LKHDITGELAAYYQRIGARPTVQTALEAEGFSKKL